MDVNSLLGKKAKNFKLKNGNEENICLYDLFNRNRFCILYFYPKAMTPGCNIQARGMQEINHYIEKKKGIILGVSGDSPQRLKKFEEKEGLKFNLLSDPIHSVARKYLAFGIKKNFGKVYDGIYRMTFFIDSNLKIVKIFDKVKTKTHHEDVMAVMKELNFK